jgi:hypothetical protein
MKTPTVDDAKPKRDNLGPTGPAKVSSEDEGKESSSSGSEPAGNRSYESELENILDRKRAQTPPG